MPAGARLAAADGDHQLAQGELGLLLGLVDHGEERGLGGLGVDDLARPQALGELVAAAEQVDVLARQGADDVAADLAGADVQDAERAGPLPGRP